MSAATAPLPVGELSTSAAGEGGTAACVHGHSCKEWLFYFPFSTSSVFLGDFYRSNRLLKVNKSIKMKFPA